jgi:hypothetical protein
MKKPPLKFSGGFSYLQDITLHPAQQPDNQ